MEGKKSIRLTLFLGLATAFMLSAGPVHASPTVSFSLTILPNPEIEKAMQTKLPENETVSNTPSETSNQTALHVSPGISPGQTEVGNNSITDNTASLVKDTETKTINFEHPIRAGP